MGQVPGQKFQYLIVGNGRVARTFQAYFKRLNIPFTTFARSQNTATQWKERVPTATHVLLLIKDDQIDSFYQSHPELKCKVCVHFSGAFFHPDIPSAHPLMTFTDQVLPIALQDKMVFITEAEGPLFSTLLPGIPNPSMNLTRDKKALYHAWCVMSGNFTTLLWESAARAFEEDLDLGRAALAPYLEAITGNLENGLKHKLPSQLTGPFARGDLNTIDTHLDALAEDDFKPIYQAFWTTYQQQRISR